MQEIIYARNNIYMNVVGSCVGCDVTIRQYENYPEIDKPCCFYCYCFYKRVAPSLYFFNAIRSKNMDETSRMVSSIKKDKYII